MIGPTKFCLNSTGSLSSMSRLVRGNTQYVSLRISCIMLNVQRVLCSTVWCTGFDSDMVPRNVHSTLSVCCTAQTRITNAEVGSTIVCLMISFSPHSLPTKGSDYIFYNWTNVNTVKPESLNTPLLFPNFDTLQHTPSLFPNFDTLQHNPSLFPHFDTLQSNFNLFCLINIDTLHNDKAQKVF